VRDIDIGETRDPVRTGGFADIYLGHDKDGRALALKRLRLFEMAKTELHPVRLSALSCHLWGANPDRAEILSRGIGLETAETSKRPRLSRGGCGHLRQHELLMHGISVDEERHYHRLYKAERSVRPSPGWSPIGGFMFAIAHEAALIDGIAASRSSGGLVLPSRAKGGSW
jgi:hypothetical protein